FSKQGKVTVLDNSVIGCDVEKCGIKGSPTRVLKTFENERGKRNCTFITLDELLPLIEKLKAQPRSNEKKSLSSQKLKSVWAVGEEVLEKAREVSEEVILIEKLTPEEISERALKDKPDVILWNADLWGRKNAPIVAAILNTGLCADCTELETDGDNLIMYRPAQGGSIYAKIKCLKKPQMATVRTQSNSSDIIVAAGKGVADKTEKIQNFAKEIGAELASSRGLVDMGKAPYESQVGLTGKVVSPKIYIAIGISGAVHHTCAIEGADMVIAINPDKDARIFEYADYGICTAF
ncbi:MAG: electron transfer flavoprotein subunit alpha/FixB family protein, partial [Clostridia bacterium]|nr:electron transfer flavoprotein subunit alpha/FixB family protein [Clostridia bacterium]